jgi:phosphoribosylanthranilate isomerase
MVKLKFCGITNHQDALLAAKLGVDALGFVFAPSPRQVKPETARRIIGSLPPLVRTVGVFVDENPALMRDIVNFCGLDMVQLHGNEPPHVCADLMPRAIKAFCLKDEQDLRSLNAYYGKARAFLFDGHGGDRKGGTGTTFDWSLAVKAKELGVPVILAGGLNPGNVRNAIRTVRPYAVDVSSGIEESPGKKNPLLMREFIQRIRRSYGGELAQD